MKRIVFCSVVVIIAIVVTNDENRVVIAQEMTDYWTPILSSLPTAVMGAINLALVSRLATDPNRSLGQKLGFDKLADGQKMLFVGKHNIQVSNHKEKTNNEEVVEEGDDGFEDEYEDSDYEDDEDDYSDDYDEDGQDDYSEDYTEEEYKDNGEKSKYKKKKNGKYKKKKVKMEENGEEKKYKTVKEIKEVRHVFVNPPSDHSQDNGHHFNDHFSPEDMDYKKLMVKNAISEQYPQLDQNQVYWPETDETKGTVIYETDSQPNPNNERLFGITIPDKVSKIQIKRPVFKSFVPQISTEFQPINELTSEAPMSLNTGAMDTGQQFNLNEEEQHFRDLVDSYKNDIDSSNEINYMRRSDGRKRSKRSTNSFIINRLANMPPLRINRTSAQVFQTRLSSEMIRQLLSGDSGKTSNRMALPKDRLRVMPKKSTRRPKKRQKYEIASSNRVVKKTKMTGDVRLPITYLPLNQYKKILNYSPDRKPNKKKRKKKKKFRDEEMASSNNEFVDDYYEYDNEDEDEDEECDDCEDVGDEYEDESDVDSGKSHTTVQIIEKPVTKFNKGIGGWMRRVFTKKNFFKRGD